jgi:hypothetical protein
MFRYARQHTRNEQVSGSSPLVGSLEGGLSIMLRFAG